MQFLEKNGQIIGWHPPPRLVDPLWEILDPSLIEDWLALKSVHQIAKKKENKIENRCSTVNSQYLFIQRLRRCKTQVSFTCIFFHFVIKVNNFCQKLNKKRNHSENSVRLDRSKIYTIYKVDRSLWNTYNLRNGPLLFLNLQICQQWLNCHWFVPNISIKFYQLFIISSIIPKISFYTLKEVQ